MPLSKITTKSITDGTIAAADLATDAVTSAKIADGVIVTADLADNSITQAKINSAVQLGAGYYIDKTGSVVGNSSGRDNLFRVNTNATTANVTIAANNNASVAGPLTVANGTTLTISNTGRLVILWVLYL